ncbi:hypothetical protein EVAR_50468_1 [Eumeta japonica]|uniref:Uncharacterized protein n=1 Tax=Eumeta variegata TaxID=151549 RepID=A0A4C1XUC4_EUMVA|nr:hypothetical protein EVAR_50468_1 [Eumeta japonica]
MLLPRITFVLFWRFGSIRFFEMTIRKVTRLYADALWEDDFVSKTACYTSLIHVTITQSSAPAEAGVRVEADAVGIAERAAQRQAHGECARAFPSHRLAVTANSGPQMELISFA